MFNPDEYNKTFEKFFKNGSVDLTSATETYKTFSEKAANIIKESLTKHSDITQKWTEESLKNLESFSNNFPDENIKASSEFVMAQTKLAPKYLEEYSENAKKMQTDFTELLIDSTNAKEKKHSKPSPNGK